MVIGGDWKQNPPVIVGGSSLDQYTASVKNSELFKHFTTYRLTQNFRLKPDQEKYRRWIKRVSVGALNDNNDRVQVPKALVVYSTGALLDFVFPNTLLSDPLNSWGMLAGRAILCPLNVETFQLQNRIMVNNSIFLSYLKLLPIA